MNLEQKIEYYKRSYVKNGLPDEIKAKDFFNEDFLDYLLKNKYGFIKIKFTDFEELLRDPLLFNKTTHLLLNYFSTQINSSNFYELLINNSNLFNYISNKIINNDVEDSHFHKLLNDNRTLELLKPLVQKNISFFVKMIEFQSVDTLKDMLLDPVWKEVYFFVNYDDFFSSIKELGLDIVGVEYITKKLNSLDYNETLEVLTKYYDSTNGEPAYFQETYKIYENEIRKNKIGKLLEGLNENSSEETIRNVKYLLSTDIGMDILLSSFKNDAFEKISRIVGLNPEIIDMRKNCFLQILSNYENYSLDTLKNVFSLYYFEDIASNTVINFSVILKYAACNNEAKRMLGPLFEELEIIYNYLIGNQSINPMKIMKNSSINSNTINEIMNKMYELFNQDINKSTSSEIVLKNATAEEKNGVVIYHLDNTNEGAFLIHSISDCDEDYYEKFCEKSKNNSKICMSLLDANHTTTFIDGIVFGYLNLEYQLYSATVSDGQTNQRTSLLRQYNSDLTTIEQFMNNTSQDSYNELAYLTNNKPVMPSYILCVDREPNDLEIKIAKDFDIPIYVYPKRKEIIELPEKQIEHQAYDYETSRIQIIPKRFSKEIIIEPDESSFSFKDTSTHK